MGDSGVAKEGDESPLALRQETHSLRERFNPRIINSTHLPIDSSGREPLLDIECYTRGWRHAREAEHGEGGITGRTFARLLRELKDLSVDPLEEIKRQVVSAAENGEGELWILDIGAGLGTPGFELVAAANDERLANNGAAEEVVALAEKYGVRICYLGLTERPEMVVGEREETITNILSGEEYRITVPTLGLVEEKTVLASEESPTVSAILIAYNLDYEDACPRTLREILTEDFGQLVSPRIIFLNHLTQYVTPQTKGGLMKDICAVAPSNSICLAIAWESVAAPSEKQLEVNAQILREMRRRRNFHPLTDPEGRVNGFILN